MFDMQSGKERVKPGYPYVKGACEKTLNKLTSIVSSLSQKKVISYGEIFF